MNAGKNRRWLLSGLAGLLGIGLTWLIWSHNASTVPLADELPGSGKGSNSETVPNDNTRQTYHIGPVEDQGHLPYYFRLDRTGYSVSVFEKKVSFPDGDHVVIRFHPAPSGAELPIGLDNGDPGFYERLMPEVRKGNPIAAQRLFASLSNCENAPRTEDDLYAYLDSLDQTYSYPDKTKAGGVMRFSADSDIESEKAVLTERYERCQGVSDELVDNAYDHLKVAADGGMQGAAIEYGRWLQKNSSEQAIDYFEKAWQKGDAAGAYELGRLYKEGKISGAPDPVTAYAYLSVYKIVFDAQWEGLVHPVYVSIRKANDEVMDNEFKGFSLSTERSALPLIKALLSENTNCCTL
jgi:hypothetical protein